MKTSRKTTPEQAASRDTSIPGLELIAATAEPTGVTIAQHARAHDPSPRQAELRIGRLLDEVA